MEDNIESDKVDIELQEVTPSELLELNLERFIDELKALNDTLPIQTLILSMKNSELRKRLEGISENIEESENDNVKYVKYTINKDHIDELSKIHKQITRTDLALKIIPRNYIVSIVSQFDAFMGELVRILYEINPNLIRASDKSLNVKDLFRHSSIDDLKEQIIDKEVESILREDHFEQLKILERRVSSVTNKHFTLTKNLPILSDFVELTQRRNLFVHSNGLVTRQYLSVLDKWNNTKESNTISLNEELKASPEYCKAAFRILFEIAVKLTHVLWRKFVPKKLDRADIHLNQISFELLIEQNYDLAITICSFATDTLKNHSTEQIRKFFIINMAIAYKQKKNEKKCKEILDKEDWSIGNEFKLAKLVLEDKFDEAKKMMLRIGKDDELIDQSAYQNWPLFLDFRKSEAFQEGYFALYNEEFKLEEIQEQKEDDNKGEIDTNKSPNQNGTEHN